MAISYKITGLSELISSLDDFKDEVVKEVDAELTASAFTIQTDAQSRAPVDLGFLRNSISIQSSTLQKNVIAAANYAAFVEFGTGSNVDIDPQGEFGTLTEYFTEYEQLRNYALQFFVSGKGHLPAHPFFFPAVAAETPQLLKRLIALLNDAGRKF